MHIVSLITEFITNAQTLGCESLVLQVFNKVTNDGLFDLHHKIPTGPHQRQNNAMPPAFPLT